MHVERYWLETRQCLLEAMQEGLRIRLTMLDIELNNVQAGFAQLEIDQSRLNEEKTRMDA